LCATFNEQRHEDGHFDCTSFVYTAGGVRWIMDPGGSSLHGTGPARQYLISSRAHNVAILGGRDQTAGTGWIMSQATLEDASLVQIGTNVHGPHYDHSRTFICLNDLSAMAVIDKFGTTQGNIDFEGLLHFGENIAVALAHTRLAIGFRNRSRLQIIPHLVTGTFGGMAIQNGCSNRLGTLQGFLSHRAGGLQPANVLGYRFSGETTVSGGVILTTSERGLRRIQDLLASQEIKVHLL
jgi:hypothetical protein